LVGDGVLRGKIERLILRLNLQKQLILTGWRRDIPDILSASDVFVLNSLWEGLPVTALEALASGRPVIATHTGGISEVIIEGRNGFLVPPTDMQGMCKQLTILLRNPDLRKAMSGNAKEALTSDFLLDSMVEKTKNLYKDLISEKEVRRAS
jgi:glycosyltransferase involved in cell wall biosynthesis